VKCDIPVRALLCAIVNKDVPAIAIVAGIPARVIRMTRFKASPSCNVERDS